MSSMDAESGDAKPTTPGFRIKRGRASFVQVAIAVITDREISDGAFRLFCTVSAYARNDEAAFVGQEVLAEALAVSDRTIRRWLNELEKAGLIEIDQRGQRRTNLMAIAGDDEIRDLYAGSLGQELPRKRGSHAQKPKRVGQQSPRLVDVNAPEPAMDIEPEEVGGYASDRTLVSGPWTGHGCPVPSEVEAGESEAARASRTHLDHVEEDLVDERVRLTYAHNDGGLTEVFLGPVALQDQMKAAGVWDDFLGAAFLARDFQTHIRTQVLEMCLDQSLTVEKQVARFQQAVLEVRSGQW